MMRNAMIMDDVFGRRLRAVREARGMNQDELASEIGVVYQQVSRWESGKTMPTGATLARLATILNVSVDYLLGLVDLPTGLLMEEGLSPDERRLIQAVRNGQLEEVLQQVLAGIRKQ